MPNLARRRKELLLANGSWKRKASSFSKPPGGFLWEKLSLRLITGKPISKMLTRYTPEELEMHLQSGKVVWRECPYTSGTFEYKDTQNWHKAINTARQKEWQRMRTWSSSALTAIPCLWMKALEKVVPRALEKARGPLEKAEEAGAEPSRRRRTRMSLIPMRSLPRLAGLPGIWCLQQCQTWKKLWKKQVPS
jgi:hypothetical protein